MNLNKYAQTKLIREYFYFCEHNKNMIYAQSMMGYGNRRLYKEAPYSGYNAKRLQALTAFVNNVEREDDGTYEFSEP